MNYKARSVIVFTISLFLFTFLTSYLTIPKEINVIVGKDYQFDFKSPFLTTVTTDAAVNTNGKYNLETPLTLKAGKSGSYDMKFDFLGLFTVKRANLNVLSEIRVYPSGQSCGVKILTDGVMVIATGQASDTRGMNYTPAKTAGILAGDLLKSANGEAIKNTKHFRQIINENKENPLEITYIRNGNTHVAAVTPIHIGNSNYVVGMWVRDSTAGLGTLTFYSEDKGKFAALGHSITDIDTGELMPVKEGDLISASIAAARKGDKGSPGELSGVFEEPTVKIGTISHNSDFGLYGKVDNEAVIPTESPVPIALRGEVTEGPAEILTTIDGDGVERFQVEIIKKYNQPSESIKSMVIKVTDERLIEKTGGIVQGMSGSPILQNGKLVGAVTHVFVNDPLKGYGIFIEWMINQM